MVPKSNIYKETLSAFIIFALGGPEWPPYLKGQQKSVSLCSHSTLKSVSLVAKLFCFYSQCFLLCSCLSIGFYTILEIILLVNFHNNRMELYDRSKLAWI